MNLNKSTIIKLLRNARKDIPHATPADEGSLLATDGEGQIYWKYRDLRIKTELDIFLHDYIKKEITVYLIRLDNNSHVNDGKIEIQENGIYKDIIELDEHGKIIYTYVKRDEQIITFKYGGNFELKPCQNSCKASRRIDDIITFTDIDLIGYKVTVNLRTTEDDDILPNAPISGTLKVKVNNINQPNITTNDEGKYVYSYIVSSANSFIDFSFDGDDDYVPISARYEIGKRPTAITFENIDLTNKKITAVLKTTDNGTALIYSNLHITDNNVVKPDVTTDDNGKYTYTYTATEDQKVKFVYDGTSVFSSSESTYIVPLKIDTTITFTDIDIVGKKVTVNLKDIDGSPISAQLTVKVNNTNMAPITTDANGKYVYTYNTVAGSTLDFTYNGDGKYNGTSNRYVVDKTPTEITITDTDVANNTVTMKLSIPGGNPLLNQLIHVKENGVDKPDFRTGTGGLKVYTYTATSGQIISFTFDGDNSFIGSTKDYTIPQSKIETRINVI